MTKIAFYEIDGGPSGKWWEAMKDESYYLGTFDSTEKMLDTARILSMIGHDIRFYTQAEYELNLALEEV